MKHDLIFYMSLSHGFAYVMDGTVYWVLRFMFYNMLAPFMILLAPQF